MLLRFKNTYAPPSETILGSEGAINQFANLSSNGSIVYSYSYDDLGQLTRENNADTNRTYLYTYDSTGNIQSKKVYGYTTAETVSTTLYNTYTYTYGKTEWNDLLQGYNGVNFSNDDMGNPLSYYNGSPYTFTWKQGRRLATADVNGYELEFTYKDEGIRTAKMFDYNNGIVDVTHYIISFSYIHKICYKKTCRTKNAAG